MADEVEALRATVRRWARERVPVGHLRALRDAEDPVGFSRERWRELAALGGVGAGVPERWGGGGLSWAALGGVVEELGRSLAPLPWLSALLGGGALLDGGSDAQRRAWLPGICAGERIVALAHDEGTRHARAHVATRAERVAGGFALRGEKVMVLDGHVADAFVVSARTGGADDARGGISLFLVAAGARGLGVTRTHLCDSRNAARVGLDGVVVAEADVVGGVDRGADLLDPLFDRAQIALGAEMLGGAEEVLERTLTYLKTRRQFGVPIGSFQALQHRAAYAYCEVALLRAVVQAGLRALDAGASDVPRLACAVKARAADAFTLCAAEAVQMHGGVGVTDELDIGLFYKRARVAAMLLGDAAWQRDRFAQLSGY